MSSPSPYPSLPLFGRGSRNNARPVCYQHLFVARKVQPPLSATPDLFRSNLQRRSVRMQSTIVSCCIHRMTVPRTRSAGHGQGALLHLALEPVRATGGPRYPDRANIAYKATAFHGAAPASSSDLGTSSPLEGFCPPVIDLRGWWPCPCPCTK